MWDPPSTPYQVQVEYGEERMVGVLRAKNCHQNTSPAAHPSSTHGRPHADDKKRQKKTYSIGGSPVIPHQTTNPTRGSLTSEFGMGSGTRVSDMAVRAEWVMAAKSYWISGRQAGHAR